MELGYIGLGAMGGALARRLLQSGRIHVFDLSKEAMAAFADLGASPAKSPADLARICDIVLLCLPRSADVRKVIFAENGLIEGLASGKIVIDQTSGSPHETREMAAELEARNIRMLDAPVSGGPGGAAAGTIAIMVGGKAADYDAARPVFDMISPNHVHCGDIGAGQVIKLVNNTISTCNRLAMLEAVALGIKNGLDPAVICDVLNKSGARSKATENLLPAVIRGEQSSNFALSLMLKDLNLATQLAIENGVPLLFGQLARGMLQVASNEIGPKANLDQIADSVADQAGISFKSGSST